MTERYPTYLRHSSCWFGELPAHWTWTKVKHAARFVSGGTPSKENPKYWGGETPWASAKDLKKDAISDTIDHITDLAVREAAHMIEPNDLMIVVRGMILAHTFPVTKALVSMAINQDVKGVRPAPGWSADYFAAVLRASSPETLSRLDEAGHGTKALRMDAWGSMPLPQPPLLEQSVIAAFLDRETVRIDALVAEQERLMELLEEKRQAVIALAVTRGLEPTVTLKDSGEAWLGPIPSTWRVERGRWLFNQRDVPPAPEDGVVTAFRDGEVTLRTNRRTDGFTLAFLEVGYQRVFSGDLVIHGMDAFAGAIGVSDSTGKCTPEYVVLEPREPGPSNRYFALVLRLMALRNWIYVICPSVRERAPRFRFEAFKDVLLPVPPPSEQHAIVSHLDRVLAELQEPLVRVERSIELLRERRTALITAAVTGQIDVRGAA